MIKLKSGFAALFVLVGGVLALAASTGASTSSGKTGVIKIAVNAPLTGPGAGFGVPEATAFRLVANQYNSHGGMVVAGKRYKIKIVADDDKWDPTTTHTMTVKEVSQDHVKFITTVGDPVDPVIVPVAEKAHVITIDWTGNKYFLRKPYKYVIGTFEDTNSMGLPFYKTLLKRQPKIKSMYYVAYDLQFDINHINYEKAEAKKLGIKWLGDIRYPPSTVNFTSVLAPVVNAHPDLVAIGGESSNAPIIVKTLRQLGYKGIISSAVIADSLGDIVKGAGSAANGMYQAELFSYPETKALKKFETAYRAQQHGNWSTLATNFWVDAQLLLSGIRKAGTTTDTTKIMAALRKTVIKDPFMRGNPNVVVGGQQEYGRPAEIRLPVMMNQYQNGKYKTVDVIHVPPKS
jgi:branched-chain amino acid transport system substrate-binding protein